MSTAIAPRPSECITPSTSVARARTWRPFPSEVADIVCVEAAAASVQPRIHGRLALTLLRSPAMMRAESSRSVVADRNWIVVVPAWQLYALRALGDSPTAAVTLLLGASHAAALGALDRPALVTDADIGAQLASTVAQLGRPLQPVECAGTIRAQLERLAARVTPAAAARSGRFVTPLAPIRDYLRAHLGEQVTTAELARLSGLTEWHLIRAFHREFGLPPHAYHTRLRLAAAGELLSQGLGVSTAAYECGFADQSHLSRQFKEVYGLTPAAWAAATAQPPRRRAPRNEVRPFARRGAPASHLRHSLTITPLVRRGDNNDHR
jgi:AraC-like DNA-binding protein